MVSGCCVDGKCTGATCMRLYAGQTCGTCAHFKRCLALGFTSSADAIDCDFFPRRYLARTVKAASP